MLEKQQLVEDFIEFTTKSIFLTGKAGTGKTTLVKKICETTSKSFVIVAPTGVAAINAGGVTIHSFFQLPPSTFLPTHDVINPNTAVNRNILLEHARYRKDKRDLIQKLDLLIIDEISMVRADLLDAIDWVLQFVRRDKRPFGGIQLLVIGDLFQLPPVVKQNERNLLSSYYNSSFFFSSFSWQNTNAVSVELDHVYRQKDEMFLQILNEIRHQNLSLNSIAKLKKHTEVDFDLHSTNNLLLTTHNKKANQVNVDKMKALSTKSYTFKAIITGEFNESHYPVSEKLILKEGARIMFLKNHPEKLYYNGKIGTISEISIDKIMVLCDGDKKPFKVEKESWSNIEYKLNKKTNNVDSNIKGEFSQYPLKPAWAITIHKSQGLTFNQLIIDAGRAFAPGQVYVAIRRCTSLKGLTLLSEIDNAGLYINPIVSNYHQNFLDIKNIKSLLEVEKTNYTLNKVVHHINIESVGVFINDLSRLIREVNLPFEKESIEMLDRLNSTYCNRIS